MKDARRFAPATARNRAPIIDVLARVLPASGTVLEIASGSGEHAAAFAARFPALVFQPSDPDAANRASIDAWIEASGCDNLEPSLELDVADPGWTARVTAVDALVCINMVHIAPWAATLGLFEGAMRLLPPWAPLYLYGPYKRNGVHTAPSNAAFDADLRSRDAAWGVRDLEAVVLAAETCGFVHAETVEMPANNLSVILRRVR